MTHVIRWWLSAPMSGGKATALVLGAWIVVALLVAIPDVVTHQLKKSPIHEQVHPR